MLEAVHRRMQHARALGPAATAQRAEHSVGQQAGIGNERASGAPATCAEGQDMVSWAELWGNGCLLRLSNCWRRQQEPPANLMPTYPPPLPCNPPPPSPTSFLLFAGRG